MAICTTEFFVIFGLKKCRSARPFLFGTHIRYVIISRLSYEYRILLKATTQQDENFGHLYYLSHLGIAQALSHRPQPRSLG
jgi:hypothetical protein